MMMMSEMHGDQMQIKWTLSQRKHKPSSASVRPIESLFSCYYGVSQFV